MILRQIDHGAPVPAADVEHAQSATVSQQPHAILKHPGLSHRRYAVANFKQPMMQVIAPKRAIDKCQRVVVLANLGGRDHSLLRWGIEREKNSSNHRLESYP